MLAARDDGWQPRPFLDSIEIQFGRSLRDQAVDLELGRADVVEQDVAAPLEASRGAPVGGRVLLVAQVAHEPLSPIFVRNFGKEGPVCESGG